MESMESQGTTPYAPAIHWPDQRRIDLSQCYEVRDRCKTFGFSNEALHDAVKAVRPSAQKVGAYEAMTNRARIVVGGEGFEPPTPSV